MYIKNQEQHSRKRKTHRGDNRSATRRLQTNIIFYVNRATRQCNAVFQQHREKTHILSVRESPGKIIFIRVHRYAALLVIIQLRVWIPYHLMFRWMSDILPWLCIVQVFNSQYRWINIAMKPTLVWKMTPPFKFLTSAYRNTFKSYHAARIV